MQGILGTVSFSGEAMVPETEIHSDLLNSVQADPDPKNFYLEGGIGLWHARRNHSTKPVPAFSFKTPFYIVADACLTNRTELLKKFGVLVSGKAKIVDAQLILKAYEKWGEDCVEHLTGDFAFAVWDRAAQKLFCARDHLGGSRFFYYWNKETFFFGSTPNDVLGFRAVEKTFNPGKLAAIAYSEPHFLTENESWYKNIKPLSAGSVLTVGPGGISTRKYWTPAIPGSLPYKSEGEILEAFRELMFEIVGARLESYGTAAGLLSGGLDSSAIIGVASRVLEEQNKEITVFSSVLADPEDPEFEDERSFIDQFRTFPNVRIKYVSAPGKGPFSDLELFFSRYDTPVITSRHYLYSAFFEEAAAIGARTIIDGGYGECGPTNSGEGCFAEMLGKFKLLTLARELRLRNKLYGESVRYNFRAHAVNPLLPEFLIRMRKRNATAGLQPDSNHLLNEKVFRNLAKTIDLPGSSDFPTMRISPDHRKNQLRDIDYIQRKNSDFPSATFGSASAIELRSPFLDKRLLEFCLAVPLNLKVRDGYTRYLIRAGLDKILPSKIQWRVTKTPFSPDYMRRYNAQLDKIKRFVEEIKPNDPVREVVDIEKLKGLLANPQDKSIGEKGHSVAAYYSVPRAIYLIYFLRKFSEFRL